MLLMIRKFPEGEARSHIDAGYFLRRILGRFHAVKRMALPSVKEWPMYVWRRAIGPTCQLCTRVNMEDA